MTIAYQSAEYPVQAGDEGGREADGSTNQVAGAGRREQATASSASTYQGTQQASVTLQDPLSLWLTICQGGMTAKAVPEMSTTH